MSKIDLTTVASLKNATTALGSINSNNAVLEAAFDNTLSRDGSGPNQMQSNIDMDGHRIVNHPDPVGDNDLVTKAWARSILAAQNLSSVLVAVENANAAANRAASYITRALNTDHAGIASLTINPTVYPSFTVRNGATYSVGSSSDLMAIKDAGGSWWKMEPLHSIIFGDWLNLIPNSASGAAYNGSVINKAMAVLDTRGGGTLYLPAGDYYVNVPVDNKYPRVHLQGQHRDAFHDVSSPGFGTRIYMTDEAQPVLRLRSPFISETGNPNSARITGSSIKWIQTEGGATGIIITSVAYSEVDIHVHNAVGSTAVELSCGTSYVDLNDIGDSQFNDVRVSFRLDATACASTTGVTINGSDNANWCFNERLWFHGECQYIGAIIQSADNNDDVLFDINIVTNPNNSGPHNALECWGTGTAPNHNQGNGCNSNFVKVSANGPIIVQGTEITGISFPAGNDFLIDFGNGTPLPVLGTGCLQYTTVRLVWGQRFFEKHVKPVFSNTYAGSVVALGLIGSSDTAMFHNSSAAAAVGLTDGTSVYGLRVSGGKLRFNARTSATPGYAFDYDVTFGQGFTHTPQLLPEAPVEGQTIYDSADKKVKTWNGTAWMSHY